MNPSMLTRREMMGMAGAGAIAGRLGGAIGHRGGAARILEIPPVDEIVNLQQFEDIARQVLDESLFAAIAGADRGPFDYLSFRPRQNVPTLDMDLGISLFGQTLLLPSWSAPSRGSTGSIRTGKQLP